MPNFQVIFQADETMLVDHFGGLEAVKFAHERAWVKHGLNEIELTPPHLVLDEVVLVIRDLDLILKNEHLSKAFDHNYSIVIVVPNTDTPVLNKYVDFEIEHQTKDHVRVKMFFNKNKFFGAWAKAGYPLDTEWLGIKSFKPEVDQNLELLDQLAEVANTFSPGTSAERMVFDNVHALLDKYSYGK